MSSSEISDSSSDTDTSSISQAPHAKDKIEESSTDSDDGSESEENSSDAQSGDEDVPVVSHAEKRRQKKKEQKSASEQKDSEASTPRRVKNTATIHDKSKLPKRQNSVWVGNLSFKTTSEALKRFFDGAGEITRVHMPMKMASTKGEGAVKENRGFAYVDFATSDAKVVAIALSENPLDGRRLLIKDGGDFNGRPSTSSTAPDSSTNVDSVNGSVPGTGTTKTARKILSAQKQPAGPTLFLGNLSFETTEQSIRDMFGRNSHPAKAKKRKGDPGEEGSDDGMVDKATNPAKSAGIRKIRMGTFEDTGKCKGWTFVDFISVEASTAALTNPKNHHLDGRELVVEFASPEAVRRGGIRKPGDKVTHRTEHGKQSLGPVEGSSFKRKAALTSHDEDPPAKSESPSKRRKVEGDSEQETLTRDPTKTPRFDRAHGKHGTTPKTRPKPGAALALAKRQDPAILPSQGQKIVF